MKVSSANGILVPTNSLSCFAAPGQFGSSHAGYRPFILRRYGMKRKQYICMALLVLGGIFLSTISHAEQSPYAYEEVYDAMSNTTLQEYSSNKETTIKSAQSKLSFASGVDIFVGMKDDPQGKRIKSIELQLHIVRSQLFAATKGSAVLKMTPKELIQLKPFIPITVILTGSEQLKSLLQASLDQKQTVEQALAAMDPSGFPAVLNVENYTLKMYFQSVE